MENSLFEDVFDFVKKWSMRLFFIAIGVGTCLLVLWLTGCATKQVVIFEPTPPVEFTNPVVKKKMPVYPVNLMPGKFYHEETKQEIPYQEWLEYNRELREIERGGQ